MKTKCFALFILVLLASASALPLLAAAKPNDMELVVLELRADDTHGARPIKPPPPQPLDPEKNDNYATLGYSFATTANYYINPSNTYGFATADIENTISVSAETWDAVVVDYEVFTYMGTTTATSGNLDGLNVVDWGRYRNGVIAVTMIWRYVANGAIAEVDMKLNTRYAWSLTGESNKMDVQNIVTHEFGHWAGLADLYNSEDGLLTMYGYSGYGVTYQRDLGLGDKLGITDVYT